MGNQKGDYLSILDDSGTREILLSEKEEWTIGRSSSSSKPDITLDKKTVSREHGKLVNCTGIWCYYNCKSKNNTFLNGELIKPGIGGRIVPVMLKDGDVLIFGAGQKPEVNEKTVEVVFHEGTQ